MDPKTFLYGVMAGIAVCVGTLVFVSAIAGIKWQPVSVRVAQ